MPSIDDLGSLTELPLDIEAELDRLTMTVEQILALVEGSVIRMNRSAGDTIDVYVGGACVGSGEIVLTDNALGCRITSVREAV